MATKKIDPTFFNDFMEENRRTKNEMKKEIKSLKKLLKMLILMKHEILKEKNRKKVLDL